MTLNKLRLSLLVGAMLSNSVAQADIQQVGLTTGPLIMSAGDFADVHFYSDGSPAVFEFSFRTLVGAEDGCIRNCGYSFFLKGIDGGDTGGSLALFGGGASFINFTWLNPVGRFTLDDGSVSLSAFSIVGGVQYDALFELNPIPAPIVPEASTWLMMLLGFLGISALMAKEKHNGRAEATT